MKSKYTNTVGLVMVLLMCGVSQAVTIYVDQATGDDMDDGLTPGTAVATVTQGLVLSSDGDVLDIGAGTYSVSNGEVFPTNFSGSIDIQGAGSEVTVLDGEGSVGILSLFGNMSNVSIQGLAVVNGNRAIGAGVDISGMSSVSLSDCMFQNNIGSIGGGIIIFDTPSINVSDCRFFGNQASIGGAMQIQINSDVDVLMSVTDSIFRNNAGSVGSAIQFQENGNGIHTLNIDKTVFDFNSNTAVSVGGSGGTSFSQFTNSLFINHTGTALVTNNSMAEVVNSTFFDNQMAMNAGDQTQVVNSIFWGNVTEIVGNGGVVSFSIVQDLSIDGHTDGGNVLDLNPMLDNDFRLMDGSPAIDMGSDQIAVDLGLNFDLDGNPRQVDALGLGRPEGVVDMGAFEKPDLIFANGFDAL